MEATKKDIPGTQPRMCRVRLDSNSCRPHQTSDAGRQLLARTIPSHVQALSPTQECQGEGWHDDVSWTWGDYYDELVYITYE